MLPLVFVVHKLKEGSHQFLRSHLPWVFLDERREGRGVDREIGPAEGAGVVD
jgi:hypothetical protein